MNNSPHFATAMGCTISLLLPATVLSQQATQATLVSGEYHITQSWSQESQFKRPYFVNVPTNSDRSTHESSPALRVFMFLHGNGGNAKDAMRGFLRNRRRLASQYITVFAQGYRKSWNIVSERSKADDVGFIEAILLALASHSNVDAMNVSIMGASNGAALVNQLAIESRLPNIRCLISGVSPLNRWQYDGERFKMKGDDNNYAEATTPVTGRRLLNISGTMDNLVPYQGGPSKFIPAKNGKLAFLAAEQSTYLWAKHMGHKGERLKTPTRSMGNLDCFSYLNGNVVHIKVNDEGHGATHAIREHMLLSFLDGKQLADW